MFPAPLPCESLQRPHRLRSHAYTPCGRSMASTRSIGPRRRPPCETRSLASDRKASPAQLVDALKHNDAWVRETAQRLLVERMDVSSAPALRKLATTSPAAVTRVHALWTLDGINSLDWPTATAALRDPEPRV